MDQEAQVQVEPSVMCVPGNGPDSDCVGSARSSVKGGGVGIIVQVAGTTSSST